MEEDLRDASQEGWSFFDKLMKTDEEFRLLMGAFTTLYAVRCRKVQGVDQRSFKAAKERIVAFAATTTPWAVRGNPGDRRWGRGPLHAPGSFAGRPEGGDVERVGRRSRGVRCPGCGSETPKAVFRTRKGIQCTECAGSRGQSGPSGPSSSADRGEVQPEALAALVEG